MSDVGWLEIGALDDADRRTERQQRFDVLRGPIEVGLERQAYTPRFGAGAAVEVERRIDITRVLHVDPQQVVPLIGAFEQPVHVALAQAAIEIQTELRRLDRNLRVESRSIDLVEHLQVMPRDLLRFFGPGKVLAKRGQDRRYALRLQLA